MLWILRKPFLAGMIAILAFVSINFGAAQLFGIRLDLTKEKLFTLSEGSHVILKRLEARPIQVNFYYSSHLGKEIPAYGTFAGRVRDMLKEFEQVSAGGIIFREVDPKPFSPEEDEAVEHGLEGLPLDATGDKVYFGMAAVYQDEAGEVAHSPDGEGPVVAAIPFFQSERESFLEYDLIKTIYTLENPELPVVGVISEAPLFGNPMARMQGVESQPWAAIGQAGDFFQFEEILNAADILNIAPDILMVAHPGNLQDDMQYAIEQFMMRGGKAVFMLDPWFESKGGAGGYAPDRSDASVDKLLKKWGIELAETKVVGDKNLGRQVNGGREGEVFPAPYLVWVEPTAAELNKKDPMLADVENLLLPSSGAIIHHAESPLKMEALITSSPEAMLIPIEKLRQPDVMTLLDEYEKDDGAPFIMAARFNGAIETAFPDGPPPLTAEEQEELDQQHIEAETTGDMPSPTPQKFPEHLATSKKDINLIVIADADFMADRFWVRVQEFFGQQMLMPFGDNGAFMLATLESLNGSGELMGLRGRGIAMRPFTLIEDIQNAAEVEYRARERELTARLQEIEQQLAQLQAGNVNNANLVGAHNAETEAAIGRFTQDMLEIRAELRHVHLALREDIESLEGKVRFVNIALIPILLAILAVIVGYMRRRQYR